MRFFFESILFSTASRQPAFAGHVNQGPGLLMPAGQGQPGPSLGMPNQPGPSHQQIQAQLADAHQLLAAQQSAAQQMAAQQAVAQQVTQAATQQVVNQEAIAQQAAAREEAMQQVDDMPR